MDDVSYRTGQTISQQRSALAEAIVAEQYAQQPEVWEPYGARGREVSVRDANYHLSYLAESLTAADPALFTAYVGWAKALFAGLHLDEHMLDDTLQITRQVLAEALPREMQAVADVYLNAGVDELQRAPLQPPAFLQPHVPLAGLAQQYLEALLRTDRQAASQLILDALKQGARVQDIYLRVFQTSQYEVGRRWQIGALTVAQEHYCTAATQWVMAQLYPYVFRQRARAVNRRVLVFCAGGELHELGARMVADFFELAGWQTAYLGANTPPQGLAQLVSAGNLDAVAISATMTFHVNTVRDLIGVVRSASGGAALPILAGGYPFNIATQLWRRVGADAGARDAEEAVVAANGLVAGKIEGRPRRKSALGAALLIDQAGRVHEVLRDDFGWLKEPAAPPRSCELMDSERAVDFLAAVRTRGQVIDWTLPVTLAGRVEKLHCAGVPAGQNLLVVAARTGRSVRRLCQDLASGREDWAPALQSMLREWAELTNRQGPRGPYDELARINNDLSNLQRELAKRYADFERQADLRERPDEEASG